MRERAAFESAAAGYDATNGGLRRAAVDAVSEAEAAEAALDVLKADIEVVQLALQRADEETLFMQGSGRHSDAARTHAEALAAARLAADTEAASLRLQYSALVGRSGAALESQRDAFVSLGRLVEGKLASLQTAAAAVATGRLGGGAANRNTRGSAVELFLGGADVMVLDSAA